jgi:hypothetical protein
MGMALRAVTNNSNLLTLDDAQITIFIVKNVHEVPLFLGKPCPGLLSD